mgnify:CR=1 FL=1
MCVSAAPNPCMCNSMCYPFVSHINAPAGRMELLIESLQVSMRARRYQTHQAEPTDGRQLTEQDQLPNRWYCQLPSTLCYIERYQSNAHGCVYQHVGMCA